MCHPVVELDFSGVNSKDPGELNAGVLEQLDALETDACVEPRHATVRGRFRHLQRVLHQQTGKPVAVLIDDYDRLILDALQEEEIARVNRDYLRGLYSIVKSSDAHIRFCFVTGVGKFSRGTLFAGLINLIDIAMEPQYLSVCGYTETDLDSVFAPELAGLDRGRVREWYNGYRWGGEKAVYNPFDALLLFRKREFNPWWFETGTPRFLVESLVERGIPTPNLEGILASNDLLSTFDVGGIATEALLYQTGYLTIVDKEDWDGEPTYRLGCPKREVHQSLIRSLLRHLGQGLSQVTEDRAQFGRLLRNGNIAGLGALLRSVFAGIPHRWHTRNEIACFEGYYASVFHCYFVDAGMDERVEDSSSMGQLDMAVRAGGRVYLFEFNVAECAVPEAALAQLKERGYPDKYQHLGEPVHLVGVGFSEKDRNVAGFEAELA